MEICKMKKLKDLLKESKAWERSFGEKLPTLDSVQKKYEKKLNEEKYKGVFDYSKNDPYVAKHSLEDLLDGDAGYNESADNYGWNDDKNWSKAVEEYHKEMFKIVDEYVKTRKKAGDFYKTQEKIFKKWRKTDGSKWGS